MNSPGQTGFDSSTTSFETLIDICRLADRLGSRPCVAAESHGEFETRLPLQERNAPKQLLEVGSPTGSRPDRDYGPVFDR